MTNHRSLKSSASQRTRPARPSCRGGASSVLRLTRPMAARLPSPLDLSDWTQRAADVLMPVTGPHPGFAASRGLAGAR